MHPVVYYIFFFLALGAAGMALGSRKVSPEVRRQRWLKYVTYIFITGLVVLGIFFHFLPVVAGAIIAGAFAEMWRVNRQAAVVHRGLQARSFILLGLVSAGFFLFTLHFHYSYLIYLYFQVMVFDGFCQITGQLFGRHPLAPSISPAKTWEGLAGGTVVCLAVAVAAVDWVFISPANGLLFGLATALSSFAGDMLASWYKRQTGVKDYSNWLPGQGGILDRFDSFLATGCMYYLWYLLIFKAD